MGRGILVTGGAGFIGSNLVSNLLSDKFDVIVSEVPNVIRYDKNSRALAQDC
jgi:nucleoside-diphosphate-sugar epimerase